MQMKICHHCKGCVSVPGEEKKKRRQQHRPVKKQKKKKGISQAVYCEAARSATLSLNEISKALRYFLWLAPASSEACSSSPS